MSKSSPTKTMEIASPALCQTIEESSVNAIPVALAKFFSSGGLVTSQNLSSGSGTPDPFSSQTEGETLGPSNRGERFYATEEDTQLCSEILTLLPRPYSQDLSAS